MNSRNNNKKAATKATPSLHTTKRSLSTKKSLHKNNKKKLNPLKIAKRKISRAVADHDVDWMTSDSRMEHTSKGDFDWDQYANKHKTELHDTFETTRIFDTYDMPRINKSEFASYVTEDILPEEEDGAKIRAPPAIKDAHPYGDMKPFIAERPNRRRHDKLETSAVGVRQHTNYYEKFRHDPKYNIKKQITGFDNYYNSESVLNPQNGMLRDYYTKQYVRDPVTNEATMPEKFRNKINYDELQSLLQKADHYFFEERPTPVAQMLVPLRDPRTILPNSPLSNMVTSLEKKHHVGLPFSLDADQRAKLEKDMKEVELPRLRNDKDVLTYMQGQVDKMYKDSADGDKEHLNYLNSVDQRQPDMSLVTGQHWTAQMRRAEFWRKYLELFCHVDLLHTTTVRCTRAVGRVDSAAALVIMGNNRGIFTYGRGKASVREQAIRIALLKTRRNVLFTPIHENRAPYYSITGKFKASTIVLTPQARGTGLRAGRLTFALLELIGYKDASAKLRGRPNIWNIVRAWMECLKYQESYREIANMRGAHYQQMMNPWTKTPPPPSREEILELEDVAAQAFKEAVIDIFKSRQLYETDTFKPLVPHFTQRANWIEKWDRYLDMANVPQSIRLYPGFSEYLDASKLAQEKRWREEIHSEVDDAWSPTETEDMHPDPQMGTNAADKDSTSLFFDRGDKTRYRTSRDDQPYYQYYKPVEKPEFNRKAMRFTAFNQHIQDLATSSYQKAVGVDEAVDPYPIRGKGYQFPTVDSRNAQLEAGRQWAEGEREDIKL